MRQWRRARAPQAYRPIALGPAHTRAPLARPVNYSRSVKLTEQAQGNAGGPPQPDDRPGERPTSSHVTRSRLDTCHGQPAPPDGLPGAPRASPPMSDASGRSLAGEAEVHVGAADGVNRGSEVGPHIVTSAASVPDAPRHPFPPANAAAPPSGRSRGVDGRTKSESRARICLAAREICSQPCPAPCSSRVRPTAGIWAIG